MSEDTPENETESADSAPSEVSSDSPSAPSSGPSSGSSSAGKVKLLLLAAVVLGSAGVAYEYFVAQPAAQKAFDQIADASLQATAQDKPKLTNTEIRELIGKEPSETFEDKGKTVEVYHWAGGMLLNKHKLYAVYKEADGKLVFDRHRVFEYEAAGLSVVEVDPSVDSGMGRSDEAYEAETGGT